MQAVGTVTEPDDTVVPDVAMPEALPPDELRLPLAEPVVEPALEPGLRLPVADPVLVPLPRLEPLAPPAPAPPASAPGGISVMPRIALQPPAPATARTIPMARKLGELIKIHLARETLRCRAPRLGLHADLPSHPSLRCRSAR